MAAVPPITGVVKLELSGNIAGNTDWANIFHMGQAGAAWSLAALTSLWGAINGPLESLYTGNMGAAVTVSEAKLTDLTSDTSEVLTESIDWSGTRIGISAQASACVLFNHQIVRRYRGGHPRTYFPFGDAALQLDPQSWDATFIANCATNWATVMAAMSGYSAASAFGTVSYFSGGALRESPLWEPVTSSVGVLGIKSQRRRLTSTTA